MEDTTRRLEWGHWGAGGTVPNARCLLFVARSEGEDGWLVRSERQFLGQPGRGHRCQAGFSCFFDEPPPGQVQHAGEMDRGEGAAPMVELGQPLPPLDDAVADSTFSFHPVILGKTLWFDESFKGVLQFRIGIHQVQSRPQMGIPGESERDSGMMPNADPG